MLNKNDLITLAKTLANAEKSAPVAYSFGEENYNYAALNETLRKELREYAGSYAAYRANKNLIFSLIEEVIDDVLPNKMQAAYADFADIKQFAQGEKPVFRRKINARTRAKQFVTRVGLAGNYEAFRLPPVTESFEVPTSAIGGAAQMGLEEFLDGRVDFAELLDIIIEGMNELIYKEIAKALISGVAQLPAGHKASSASFDANAFDTLLIKAEAFGSPVIYCTYEFAVDMLPQESWRYTEAMKDELYRTGRLGSYKGHPVIILPQAFEEDSLTTKLLDPSVCYIVPAGSEFKPVKVAMEGETIVKEFENRDMSMDIQVYKKVGVVCVMSNSVFSFTNTALQNALTTWSLEDTVANKVEVSGSVTTE